MENIPDKENKEKQTEENDKAKEREIRQEIETQKATRVIKKREGKERDNIEREEAQGPCRYAWPLARRNQDSFFMTDSDAATQEK